MKKFFLSISLPVLLFVLACAGQGASEGAANANTASNASSAEADPAAQSSSDRGESKLSFSGANVSVEYGRPVLGSRNVETLIRPGMEWRMGSNSATTLTTDSPLKFGDTNIPAGKYVLKAKVDDSQKWWLIIEKDEAAMATVPMELTKSDSSVNQMTIDLEKKGNGGRLVLKWGTLSLATDFLKA
jgi:hypothetical protein